MEKLEEVAMKINSGYIYHDLFEAHNEVTRLINGLYKSACANFDMEKKADAMIKMWRNGR